MPRDILEIAAEQLGNPEPSIVFDTLFDAAMRALRPLPSNAPRRIEVLNVALDRLYEALTTGVISSDTARPAQHSDLRNVRRQPSPALKP